MEDNYLDLDDITDDINETSVQFKNGSIIRVVPYNTSVRGYNKFCDCPKYGYHGNATVELKTGAQSPSSTK